MRTIRVMIAAMIMVLAAGGPASAAITIVAVDPTTRQVGVAGATCAPVDFASAAVVVPGVGVAAVQGTSDPAAALAVAEAIRAGVRPGDALRIALDAAPDANALQVGAVNFGARPTAATGSSNGERTIATNGSTASVQGSYLTGYRGAERALTVVERPGPDLANRLLRALVIANANGAADRRCGDQRASSAFLIVADATGPPVVPATGLQAARRRRHAVMASLGPQVAADELANRLLEAAVLPRPSGGAAPSVYLSLLQPRGGFDAVELLRQAYQQTHPETGTPLPPGAAGTLDPPPAQPAGPDAVTILVLAGAIALVLGLLVRRSRRGDEPN